MSSTYSQEELARKLTAANKRVSINSVYSHYKNKDKYRVLNVALNESDVRLCVVYQAMYGEHLTFIRDLDNWCEQIEIDGVAVKRFEKIDD